MTGPDSRPADGITIRPVGGLGNQLFAYACGREVSQRLDCPLYVDLGNYLFPVSGETPREYQLDWLVPADNVLRSPSRLGSSRIVRGLQRRIPLLVPSNEFREQSFTYDERILHVQRGCRLTGYFQSWRYFPNVGPALRADLIRSAPVSEWSTRTIVELDQLTPWTAIHVRRGDYALAANAAYHGLLGDDYYRDALSALSDAGVDGPLVVFSDDDAAAADVLGAAAADAHFVRAPRDSHPMESIALMSRASAIITANSSFSWWGAWLADPDRTVTVAPTPWFREGLHDERDLCPPQWLRRPSSRSA